MFTIRKIDHVAVCVRDMDEALAKFQSVFGLQGREREFVVSQKTEAVLLPIGDSNIELITPAASSDASGNSVAGNEGLTRYLDKRGPGIHHIALEVEGIESALDFLKALGVPLIDAAPRIGARGHKVAFVHPKATGGVLVELVEPGAEHGGGGATQREMSDGGAAGTNR